MNVLPPSTNTAEFGLQNKNSASERISKMQETQQRVSENKANIRNIVNNDTRNSSSDRINQIQAAQQAVESNKANTQNMSNDGKAELGLQDRNTTAERASAIDAAQQKVVENHGFEARHSIKQALERNTKIINIPPLERGSLLDERI